MRFARESSRSNRHMWRFGPYRWLQVAAVVLLLAACGQSPSIVLTLDAASAALLRGSDVTVEVTLKRAGAASADVTLTISGLPANVTASFSPVTLSGGTLASTLTLSAAAAAVAGSYDVTVAGTGTGLVASADLTLDVTNLSVTGRVVSLLEIPIPGVSVRSQDDSAITGADGSFTLTGLSVPYDLAVWNQADSWVQIYEGLVAADVMVAPLADSMPSATSRSAVVSGSLAGGIIPVAANQVVMVCAEGTDGIAMGCDTVEPTESAYTIGIQWFGPATRAVTVHALQVQRDPSGYPTAYPGYATMDLTLTDTVPTVANLDLGDGVSTVEVDIDIDSPVAIVATLAAVQVGPNLTVPVAQLTSPAITHQIAMPVIDDASYTFVSAADLSLFGWQAGVTTTTATVPVPDLIHLTSPADMATGVTTSTGFSVATTTSGPKTFYWSQSSGGVSVGVTTMSTTTTIPDLTPFGLALPANTAFGWQVLGHSGDSTETATTALFDYYNLLLMLSQSSPGFTGEGTFTLSSQLEFTTAP